MGFEKYERWAVSALEGKKDRLLQRSAQRALSKQESRELEAVSCAIAKHTDAMHQKIASSMNTDADSKEQPAEDDEGKKVNAALTDAQNANLVDVKVIGDANAIRQCIIIGSSHVARTSLSSPYDKTPLAHYQLFSFLRLVLQHQSKNPLIVEGHPEGPITRENILITMPNGERISLYSEQAQRLFHVHADLFQHFMKDLFRDGRNPSFFDISAYPYVTGAHGPDIKKEVSALFLDKSERDFIEKYQPRHGHTDTMTPHIQNGRWMLHINGKWVTPETLLQDAKACLNYLERLAQSNQQREREMFERLQSVDPKHVPMAWTGLGHMQPIAEQCIAAGMRVKMVTPTANRKVSIIPPPIQIAKILHDVAEEYVKINKELGDGLSSKTHIE